MRHNMGRKAKWTKESLQNYLSSNVKNITLLSDEDLVYKNRYLWLCDLCGYKWYARIGSIVQRNSGCVKCAHKLTNEEIDKRLHSMNVRRVDDYAGMAVKSTFICIVCEYTWKTSMNSLKLSKLGCPKCSNIAKVSNEELDNRLSGRNIKRLESIINIDTPIKFQCLLCNNIWKASPTNICSGNRGCPLCCRKNEKICIDILRKHYEIIHNFHLWQVNKNINKLYSVDAYMKINHPKYIGIAIEYNGIQHYTATTYGKISIERAESNLIAQKKRDAEKKKFCEHNKIKLIEIDGRLFFNGALVTHMNSIIIPMINEIINENISSINR